MKPLLLAAVAFGLMLLPAYGDGAPWLNAQTVLKDTQADIGQSGIKGVKAHVDDIEKALDECTACFPRYDTGVGDMTVLTGGMSETLIALGTASVAQKEGKLRAAQVVALNNPYPLLALYLGSYYNEKGRFDDAVRVLDKGLKLIAEPLVADIIPFLTSERAVALARGGHLQEALDAYDAGLKLAMIDDKGKARMQRGRGFVLVEMERLDDAAAAYQESLKLEPDNPVAVSELAYITKLKMGSPKQPAGITLQNQQPKAN